ncbi:MAG TPA: M14 metallopeptidase family protein [Pyrinomonadaceae bacterium]|nr:M14 metallopeptidase family protein [Pyrinomonadaceae bacterium]
MHSTAFLRRFASFAFALLLCALVFNDADAQRRRRTTPRNAPPASAADENLARVPSPQSVLGFTPGDDRKIADWTQINDYFKRLDRASDRVEVQTVGTSTNGKPLIAAFISAPENIRELDRYREIQRRLADPRLVTTDAERERLIREGKTVVVVSCSIHSTEIVASQMSMQLAYELATARDADTREILDNTILILIPSPNPDGVDIVADWYRKSLGKPWEGSEPPEIYHHYAGHDDNRDWFMLNLAETRAVTRLLWKEWFPEIVYDVHQQGQTGSRFFVPPFYDPPNPNIAPLLLREVGLVGHKIAADEEAAGFRGVATNSLYDTWWHGGFRTAPYFHNSIGILTEAASARIMTPARVAPEQLERYSTRGLPSALPSSPLTNFPDPWPGGEWHASQIRDLELVAARAVLSMAAKYRERYLRNFYQLGVRSLDWPPRAADENPSRPHDQDVLAYIIPAGQGRDESVAKMIGALVEQGVEVYRMDGELHLTLTPAHGTVYNDARDAPPEWPAGSYIIFLRQPYRTDVQALFEKQIYPDRISGGAPERPYDVAGWTLPMQMGVEAYPVSNIRETESERRLTLVRDEREVRRDLGLPLEKMDVVKSPLPGQSYAWLRFESPRQNPVRDGVRVGIYKSWTASMDEGWTRWLFDTFNSPYISLRDTDVRAGNLREKFDVIVLPSMRMREIVEGRAKDTAPPELTGGITDAGVENLRRFVEDGGTLVCWDESTELAIKRFGLPVRNVLEGLKPSDFYCPGSVLRIEVDTAHPLARGLAHLTDAYFINSAAFEVTDTKRAQVVARYAERKEDVLRSGWLLGTQHLAGRAAVVETTLGKGRVILIGFRPQHRGQTWGTFPLVFNAIERGATGG